VVSGRYGEKWSSVESGEETNSGGGRVQKERKIEREREREASRDLGEAVEFGVVEFGVGKRRGSLPCCPIVNFRTTA
jgi:hypothetical protein